jgi:hypothetical protein
MKIYTNQLAYVYEDHDNNETYAFDSLKKAKKYAEDHWGKESIDVESWEKGKNQNGDKSWSTCEYVTITETEVK